MEREPVRSLTLPLLAVLYQFTLFRWQGLEKGSMHLIHLLKTADSPHSGRLPAFLDAVFKELT